MCDRCYEELGSPAVVTEATVRLSALIAQVYEHHSAGGNAHIVIDDWNLDDGDIDFCLQRVAENPYDDPQEQLDAERECLQLMRQCTMDERASALAMADGFLQSPLHN